MRKLRIWTGLSAVAAVSVATALVGAVPSWASESSALDARATLAAVAPGVVTGDADDTVVQLSVPSALTRSAAPLVPSVSVTTTPDDSTPQSVSFKMDGTTTMQSQDSGITTFATDTKDVARYVAENEAGVQVLTAYAKPQASYESRTTFNLPEGTTPVERENGDWYLRSGTQTTGVILAPWARDAAGKELATEYRWEGSTLVQSVDVPASATFPVVADPAWTYTWSATVTVGSPTDIHNKMHNCFNCIFPVEGAPKAFPREGQKLPLVVRAFPGAPFPVDFTCIFRTEQWVPAGNQLFPDGDFGFVFDAGKGHVDGVGSWISFDWYGTKSSPSKPIASEQMQLIIYGSIVNSNPAGIPRAAYLTGAKTNWGNFLSNYTSTLGGYPGNPKWSWLN
jgi:hypothetical protein